MLFWVKLQYLQQIPLLSIGISGVRERCWARYFRMHSLFLSHLTLRIFLHSPVHSKNNLYSMTLNVHFSFWNEIPVAFGSKILSRKFLSNLYLIQFNGASAYL